LPSAQWSIITDSSNGSNHVLRGLSAASNTDAASSAVPNIGRLSWDDYTVSFRVRFTSGSNPFLTLYFRENSENGFAAYGMNFGFGRLQVLKHRNANNQHVSLADVAVPTTPELGRWYPFELRVSGTTITVLLDGRSIAQATDTDTPLRAGGVQWSVSGAGAAVEIDDVLIRKP
jgi:hypothetical protein